VTKTAVSLPDALFDEADRLAERLGLSRSGLYARALSELLERERAGEIRESYDRAYGEPDQATARAARTAARATFRRNEW
jgi:metal-responsive CopG/Arc/MetJ family transcriptional regulator